MLLSLLPGMAFAVDAPAEPAEAVEADAAVSEADQTAPAEPESAAAPEEAEAPADAEAPAEAEAAEEPAEAEAASGETDVHSVFHAGFYVEANPAAGLKGQVAVSFDPGGSIGTLYLPGSADVSQLRFSWENTSVTVTRDGETLESGAAPVAAVDSSVTFKVTKGAALAYVTIKTVQGSADVEAMFLELDESLGTIDAMNSDDIHETSCYGKAICGDVGKFISIKGRGNSTWEFSKKPYNITFYKKGDFDKKDKAELIPGVKAKKWSLLANYLDNSLLRNKIALDLADAMGIGLPSRFVDVWMNGEYLGNYLLTPKKDYLAPDGGFMLDNDHIPAETDQFQIEGMHDMLLKHNRINIEDIGDDAADQGVDQAYIEAYFNEAFAALTDYETENYQNYFDIDSWAKMFLMIEVSKTYDCYAGNFLMHRDGLTPDDKLIAGPAWDYDIAFGRTLHKFLVGVSEPVQLNAEGWYNDSVGLFAVDKPVSLLQELGKHASFMTRVAQIYNEYQAAFADITANVDRQQALLRGSAMMNNVRWGTHSLSADYLVAPATMSLLGTGKYALHYQVTLTWDNYVYNLKEFAAKRVMWLNDHLLVDAPVGHIVTKLMPDGSVVLETVLTAGSGVNTYLWQRSEDGVEWTDVEGAANAQLTVTDDAQYRCVVSNKGPDIVTMHGGRVETGAQATLMPAGVCLRLVETPLAEGTFTLLLDGKEAGDFTFAPYGDGWSIRNEDGRYLRVVGKVLVLSDCPFVWNLENGVFVSHPAVAVTLLGRFLTFGYTQPRYLTMSGGRLAVSTADGAAVTLLKTTEA